MPYKVLVVDDSNFFQLRLKELIESHPDLTVVGVAANGQEAVGLNKKLQPDVISMDYEMPYMDGVTAVKIIMEQRPVPIVMFSSMTYEGAAITLQALEAGAVDFIPKNFSEVARDSSTVKRILHDKLILFAKKAKPQTFSRQEQIKPEPVSLSSQENITPIRSNKEQVIKKPARTSGRALLREVDIVIIGASTGGPVALAEIVCRLPSEFPVPIVMVQHMPGNFTRAFAERLDRNANLNIKQAEDGDALKSGQVLLAPGGTQLMFDRNGRYVKIKPGDDRIQYKPSVDITFASAAQVFGEKVLGIVLTGMGADGRDGARMLKEKNAKIWTQDKGSCVVYGMPAAVEQANLSDEVMALDMFASRLIKAM